MHTRNHFAAGMLVAALTLSGCTSPAPPAGTAPATAQVNAVAKKGLWDYAGKVNVVLEGKPITSFPRQWQLCLKTDGESPMVKPEGTAITHCTPAAKTATATGYHSVMTCVSTDDDKSNTMTEALDVATGKDGRTVTITGNITTTLSDETKRPEPMIMDIKASGHWAGDCR